MYRRHQTEKNQGITSGSNALHTNGIPCDNPSASNARAWNCELTVSMAEWNASAAATVAALARLSKSSPENMCDSVKFVPGNCGRLKTAKTKTWPRDWFAGGRNGIRSWTPFCVGSGAYSDAGLKGRRPEEAAGSPRLRTWWLTPVR